MTSTSFIDANIVLRFLLNDHPIFSPRIKTMFLRDEQGNEKFALDEVTVAEILWVLESFYRVARSDIAEKLEQANSLFGPRIKELMSSIQKAQE